MKRIGVLIIGCSGALALGAVTFWLCAPKSAGLSMDTADAFDAASKVFGAVVAFCGLVYAGLSFADVAAAQNAENEYRLRMNSFQSIEKWRSRVEQWNLVFQMAKDGELQKPLNELAKILEKSTEKQAAITDLLNFFEGLELEIQSEIVDVSILQDYLSAPFRELIVPLYGLIRLQQKNRGDRTILAKVIALGRRWGMPAQNITV